MKNDLSERLFAFSIRCIKYARTFPETAEYKIIKYQLIKSSTSSVPTMKNHNQVPQKQISAIKLEFRYEK